MRTTVFAAIGALLLSFNVAHAATPQHGFTAKESEAMRLHNEKMAANHFVDNLFGSFDKATSAITVKASSIAPIAEWEEAGYLIISDGITFNSKAAKRLMAQNLPADMTLVIYTGINHPSAKTQIIESMKPYIAEDRMKVIYLPTGKRGFWARDGVPVPEWSVDISGDKKFTVVDAKYYHEFEDDKIIAGFFGADVLKYDYYHEGGNFLSNSKGDCIIVDNERAIKIPAEIFETKYGCTSLLRMPHIKGIGHIDESAKFVDDETVLVDTDRYEKIIQAAGFKTIRLPRPTLDYETYTNSLFLNGTAFVPVFGEPTDAAAVKIYEDLGYKVIQMDSKSLSNDGLGSIHCITMTYPKVPFVDLLAATGATAVK